MLAKTGEGDRDLPNRSSAKVFDLSLGWPRFFQLGIGTETQQANYNDLRTKKKKLGTVVTSPAESKRGSVKNHRKKKRNVKRERVAKGFGGRKNRWSSKNRQA